MVERTLDLIIKLFHQAESVTEEGLIALNGLCLGIDQSFDINKIGTYIKFGLETNDNAVARLALGVLQDLSKLMGPKMNEYLDDFVP